MADSLSDAVMIVRGGPRQAIGMTGIKRGIEELDVDRYPSTKVGDAAAPLEKVAIMALEKDIVRMLAT